MTRAVLAALWLVACPPQAPPEPPVPLEVWFAGCDEVPRGCAVEIADGTPAELRLWTPGSGLFEVLLGDLPLPPGGEPIDGGTLFRVPVSAVPATIVIRGDRAAFELELVEPPATPPPTDEACEGDRPAGGADALAVAAQAAHCGWLGVRTADDEERASAVATRDRALAAYAQALLDAGHVTAGGKQRGIQVHLATASGDLDAAWALIDRLPDTHHAHIAWSRAYFSTIVHRRTGDLRSAMEALDATRSWQRRLDDPALAGPTDNVAANLAAVLGDLDGAVEAQQRQARLRPLVDGACDHGPLTLAENVAWHELMRRQAGRPALPDIDPTALLRRVADAQNACGAEPIDRAYTAVNRAFDAWFRDDYAQVAALLDGVDTSSSVELSVWSHGLRAAAALARGASAQAEFAAEQALVAAQSGASPDAEVFAWTVAADVHQAGGRHAQAQEALHEAQEALWNYLPDLPAGVDRGRFLGTRHRVAPRLVGLQLADGRADDAMTTLRRARARALRSLREGRTIAGLDDAGRARWTTAKARYLELRQAQADAYADRWALSGDELAAADARAMVLAKQAAEALDEALVVLGRADADDALRAAAPGELLVAWVPVGDRWVALLADERSVVHVDGPATTTGLDDLAPALAATLADHLDAVDRLTVLPWGVVHGLDMHAAPVDGVPLLERVPVAYGVDLPPRRAGAPARGGLLVVSDAREDLPHARREGDAVSGVAGATHLRGADATLEAVVGRLPGAARLHYAGHGLLDPDVVWRSGLALADGDLDVGDILALPRAPSEVVLSGCETGRSPDDAQVAALGIAQAFVMAGSDAVVSASRKVDDDTAAAIAVEISTREAGSGDLVEALRVAQLAHRDRADWQAWRVWVP